MKPTRLRHAAVCATVTALLTMTACSATPDAVATATTSSPAPARSADTGGSSTTAPTTSSASAVATSDASSSALPEKREFLFQIDRYTTANQGGQTLNMYFHYRYDAGIAVGDIPNYEDLRQQAIAFMDAVDASQNPYWEVLNQQLCSQLQQGFPIEAISCQLQVYPDDRAGLPYEPGFHSSIDTIGDIEPLAVVGPVSTG